MSILITGGHSPIAINIANTLSKFQNTILLTRYIDPSILGIVNENVQLKVSDFESDDVQTEMTKIIRDNNVNSVVFTHRYRGNFNPVKQYGVEIEFTYNLIKNLLRINQEYLTKIVILTSLASELIFNDQDYFYHSNKSALEAMVKFFSTQYRVEKLQINSIKPGAYVYKERAKGYYSKNPELINFIEESTPLKRFIQLEEISTLCKFLMFDAPLGINGTSIILDGGLSNASQSNFRASRS